MGDDQDQASASVDSLGLPTAPSSEPPEVVLEAQLLKLSRSRQWQERYFVFYSNQVLTYAHHKEDAMPRQYFRVSRESGCEVGELYVEQRHKGSEKVSLYCINISWPDDNETVGSFKDNSYMFSKFHDSFKDDTSFQAPLHPAAASSDPPSPTATPRRPSRIINNLLMSPLRPKMVSRQQSAPAKVSSFDSKRDGARRISLNPPLVDDSQSEQRRPSHSSSNGSLDELTITSLGTPNGQTRRGLRGWLHGKKEKKSDMFNNSMPNLEFGGSTLPTKRKSRGGSDHYSIPSFVKLDASLDADDHRHHHHATIHERENEHDDESSHPPNSPRKPLMSREGSEEKLRDSMATPSTGQAHTTYEDQNAAEQEKLHALYFTKERKEKKEYRKKIVEGTKIAVAAGAVAGVGVLTAGVGLAAGLVFLGAAAAAGGTAGVAEAGLKRKWQKTGKLTIATPSYEQAKLWKSTLDACLESESLKDSTWGQMFVADGRKTTSALLPQNMEVTTSRSRDGIDSPTSPDSIHAGALELPKGQSRLFLKDRNILGVSGTRWRPLEGGWMSFLAPGAQSLRIFREERILVEETSKKVAQLAVGGSTNTPLKTQIVLKAPPLDAFMCLMSYAKLPRWSHDGSMTPNSGQSASFRILEKIDDHTDIVHLICRKLYLFPSWTEPRDFVLYRYWRYETDGSYTICYESIEHPSCPPRPDFVRGDMHQACTIAPLKTFDRRRKNASVASGPECLLTAVAQVDPKGWVPTRPLPFLSNQTYADAFGVASLLQLLDIRDAIEHDRFLDVSPDFQLPVPTSGKSKSLAHEQSHSNDFVNYDLRYANRERCDSVTFDSLAGLESRPPPLSYDKWAEPDANSFLVRGPTYKKNRVKINAGASIGRLVAVDLVAVDKPIFSGMSTHPTERIQLALERERKLKELGKESDMPPFVFMVNIVLPGPPFYHAVYYYAVEDMSTIDGSNGTGSSRLCQRFLFGDSDEFRDKTFKLIPQIVEGNQMSIVARHLPWTASHIAHHLRRKLCGSECSREHSCHHGHQVAATLRPQQSIHGGDFELRLIRRGHWGDSIDIGIRT